MISRSYRFMMRMVVLSVTLLLASNVMEQKLRPFVYIGIGGAEYDSNGPVVVSDGSTEIVSKHGVTIHNGFEVQQGAVFSIETRN